MVADAHPDGEARVIGELGADGLGRGIADHDVADAAAQLDVVQRIAAADLYAERAIGRRQVRDQIAPIRFIAERDRAREAVAELAADADGIGDAVVRVADQRICLLYTSRCV